MKTYEYFQPEYVAKFQCDGQKCGAHCCRGWRISIDKKTYKKYSHLKPKKAAQEITRNITKMENSENYQVKLDENSNCPFLTEDNWCSIQKNYGEDFLSLTCATYPRLFYDFGDYFERSLTLTCPVAAELVLLDKEPLKFEMSEVPEKVHNDFIKMRVYNKQLPQDMYDNFVSVQKTSIFILQERSLTIDQRLMMFGLYCDKLEELLTHSGIRQIEKVTEAYKDLDFLKEQCKQFSNLIKFDVHEYIKTMIGILETLYGGGNEQKADDRFFLDALKVAFEIIPNEKGMVSISKIAKNYSALSEEREKFLQKFSTVLENYLVNEFFLNCHPFKFYNTLIFNYGFFVTNYKMLEFLALAISVEKDFTEKDLISQIIWYVHRMDHNIGYSNKISDYLKDKRDAVKIMQSMLQV